MASRLSLAKSAILEFFETQPHRAFRQKDLVEILNSQRFDWRLALSTRFNAFLEYLLENSPLRRVEISCPAYHQTDIRFVWGKASPFEVAAVLRPRGYLSHGSAVFFHALNDQIPSTIYINVEQSEKPRPTGTLSQAAIDRAFSGKQRESTMVFEFEEARIAILSGKQTGRLEVGAIQNPLISKAELPVTKLERTLIDIVVRPAYAGGVLQVLEAFRRAKTRASVAVLISILKKIGYSYPYHQAIGFYLERAGFPETTLDRVRALGADFNFYLAYGIRDRDYNPRWKLFVPKGM